VLAATIPGRVGVRLVGVELPNGPLLIGVAVGALVLEGVPAGTGEAFDGVALEAEAREDGVVTEVSEAGQVFLVYPLLAGFATQVPEGMVTLLQPVVQSLEEQRPPVNPLALQEPKA